MFPTACSEESLVIDGTTDIHWQRYLMEGIVPFYLVTVAPLFVCFTSPIVRLPEVPEWDWEQSPAKEKHRQQFCNSHRQKALCKRQFLFHSTHAKCSLPEVRLPLMLKKDKAPWRVHICNTTVVRLNQVLYQFAIYVLAI